MATKVRLARRIERHLYNHGFCDAAVLAALPFWLEFLDQNNRLPETLFFAILAVSSVVAFILIAPLLALSAVVSSFWYLAKREVPLLGAIPRIVLGLIFLHAWMYTVSKFELS